MIRYKHPCIANIAGEGTYGKNESNTAGFRDGCGRYTRYRKAKNLFWLRGRRGQDLCSVVLGFGKRLFAFRQRPISALKGLVGASYSTQPRRMAHSGSQGQAAGMQLVPPLSLYCVLVFDMLVLGPVYELRKVVTGHDDCSWRGQSSLSTPKIKSICGNYRPVT